MDSLAGVLLVPPDRNHILTKPQWKARYVSVGRRTTSQKDRHPSTNSNSGRSSNSEPKPLTKIYTEDYIISIFKSKDDSEPIQQWSTSCVTDCQVQMIAHRKQGPTLPTLVVVMSDKERKRRSSRTVGLISNKESTAATLWFRTPTDEHRPGLHEWAQFILSRKSLMTPDSNPPTFQSPFSPRSRDAQEYFSRPGSGNQNNRTDMRPLQHKSSSATYSTGNRDRPATFSSDSPSLRSKRSDISSPSSINQHPSQKATYTVPGQHYANIISSEAGSPGVSEPNYQGEFIEGWTTAQGRSSTMSSPTRGRESLGSPIMPMGFDVSSPPAPGETILDRAFQLGQIPGADSGIPGLEKFSSIARFDALMRGLEEKRKVKEPVESPVQMPGSSMFDADDSSDNDESEDTKEPSDSDNSRSIDAGEEEDTASAISPSAQRALAFIAARHGDSPREPGSRRPTVSRTHLSFQADSVPPPSQAPPLRPHTAHAKSRPNAAQRAQSTPQLTPIPTNKQLEESIPRRRGGEKRESGSSIKRLSFTEFTMRLSSTSGSLLVQTNTSGNRNRTSVEGDRQFPNAQRRSVSHRGAIPPPRSREWEEQERKCGWRGTVGYLGNEGGFL